jgi:3-methyladenine DNA glycosylase AlkD
MLKAEFVKKDIKKLADPSRAKILRRFFKTGPGEYGEGDIFLGVTVPQQRQAIKKYLAMPLSEVIRLLHSREHEYRFSALILLVEKYKRGDEELKEKIFKIYLANLKYANSWDLVDSSAPYINGDFLLKRSRRCLKKMAKSNNLWERRVAMLSTYAFIRQNDFKLALSLAKIFLDDEHSLMHKAAGWMLREIGKRDKEVLLDFLKLSAKRMPRIMLSYATERMTKKEKEIFSLR